MERDLVAWLSKTLPAHPLLKLGLGDDAALVSLGGQDAVVTTDLLCDGTHFLTAEASPEAIGHKALAVNLSDLAAMAAEPVGVVVSIALPREGAGGLSALDFAKRMYLGMLPLAEIVGVAIAGGDTNVWAHPLAVSITAFGRPTEHGLLKRDAAQVGDHILVTGELGGSLLGHHLDFTPRVCEALALNKDYDLHAGMDITDGLAIDLSRLITASGTGAVIDEDRVPISPAAQEMTNTSGRTPLEHALNDGEDFELLLTASPATSNAIIKAQPLDCGIRVIGEIVESGLWLRDSTNQLKPLEPAGYLHG